MQQAPSRLHEACIDASPTRHSCPPPALRPAFLPSPSRQRRRFGPARGRARRFGACPLYAMPSGAGLTRSRPRRSSAMQAGSPLLVPRDSRPSLLSKASPCRDSRPSSKCGVGAARVPILSASVSRILITPAARRGRMRGWRCGSRRARRARTRRRAGRRTSALPRGRSGTPQKSNGLLGGCC